jgi:hypothetical protein
MPSACATAAALPRLSPVTSTVRMPSACRRRRRPARWPLSVSPNASRPQQPACPSGRPARTRCGPPPRACMARAPARAKPWAPQLLHEARAAQAQLAPLHHPPCRARRRPHALGRGCQSTRPSRHQHGAGQRVLAAGLQAAAQAAVRRRDRRSAACATSSGLPSVSVPVLSKATTLTLVRQFQRLGVLDQDALRACRHAGAGHDGGGRGQAQRAGAGDDQHRDGVQDGGLPVAAWPGPSPAA